MNNRIFRGDIFYADIPDGIGSEQSGARPVLIIQNNIGNMFSPTTIVAAITSKIAKLDRLPTHVLLDSSYGLDKDSFVMFEQIYTIDKRRLVRYIGSVNDEYTIKMLNKALSIRIDL